MKVKVFIGYSHHDKRYLRDTSLLGYLKALEKEGVEFLSDERITTGNLWGQEIQAKITESNIALLLVSQTFLNSQYIQNEEIPRFLDQRKNQGMVMFPIILSACDWESHQWLKETQFLPKDGKNIASDYKNKGRREELFLLILRDLRNQAQKIQKRISDLSRSVDNDLGQRNDIARLDHQPTQGKTISAAENPFESVNADGLDYADIPYLFVSEYTDFQTINKHFDTLLEGQRGTGKTMVLRYIAFESQIYEWIEKYKKHSDAFFSNPQHFVGIYCRLEQGVFDKADLDAVDSDVRKDQLFEHRLVLYCLSKSLETLSSVFKYRTISGDGLRRLKGHLKTLLSEPGIEACQDWNELMTFASDTIDARVLEEDLHVASLSSSTPTTFVPYLTLASQFKRFLKLLQEILGIKIPFFLLLDDFDVLRASQQMCVFRTASNRQHNLVCFKYGIMSLGKKATLSGTNRRYREGDDYDRVPFDWTYKGSQGDYSEVASLITKARLASKNWPRNDFAEFLAEWAYGEKLRMQVKQEMEKEWEQLPEEKRPETKENYWTKYGNARFFQILRKKKIRHRYAGYQDILDISSGIFRQYLEICKEIVSKALSQNWTSNTGRPISAEIQNDAIRRYSQNMMHELQQTAGSTDTLLSGDIRITSKQMVTLVEGLSNLFYNRLHSKMREPEVFTFSIRDDLTANKHAKLLLDVAVRESILQEREDPYPPKTSGGPPLPTYMMNRRLIPRRDLSPRMQGRIEMVAQDIVLASTNPDAFNKKFIRAKRQRSEDSDPALI